MDHSSWFMAGKSKLTDITFQALFNRLLSRGAIFYADALQCRRLFWYHNCAIYGSA